MIELSRELRAKAERLDQGEEVVLSDPEYLALIDAGVFQGTWASMPNPQQVGTLDTWLVADIHKSHGQLHAARKAMGIA